MKNKERHLIIKNLKKEKTESNKELGKHNRCDDNLYT